jgi:hypothetical protein
LPNLFIFFVCDSLPGIEDSPPENYFMLNKTLALS